MSVIDPAALDASPLADLHEIASELSIDGYRRLRRPALIDAIIERQGGVPAKPARKSARANKAPDKADTPAKADGPEKPARSRGSRSAAAKADEPEKPARSRGGRFVAKADSAKADSAKADSAKADSSKADEKAEDRPAIVAEDRDESADNGESDAGRRRRSRGGRGGRSRAAEAPAAERDGRAEDDREPEDGGEEQVVEGVVELLPNGSGFVRVSPPEPSDDDVYVSAAQVKRCELVSGDRISGPRRAPRRSERFASLVRIDAINGAPASELADGARFDELPAAFPQERFKLGSEDPTVKAIEWLTPIGYGSRVAIVGGPRSGKSETLRRLAGTLAALEGIQLSVVLAGVRPEEIGQWDREPIKPTAAVSFAASSDSQDNTVELVIDQARRIAARGAHAVVLIDTLDGMHPHAARRAIASARNIVDGGSLTVIATSTEPLGGETTVIALDPRLTSTGRYPAIDLPASGTIRPELLVGQAGADAIASTRLAALED